MRSISHQTALSRKRHGDRIDSAAAAAAEPSSAVRARAAILDRQQAQAAEHRCTASRNDQAAFRRLHRRLRRSSAGSRRVPARLEREAEREKMHRQENRKRQPGQSVQSEGIARADDCVRPRIMRSPRTTARPPKASNKRRTATIARSSVRPRHAAPFAGDGAQADRAHGRNRRRRTARNSAAQNQLPRVRPRISAAVRPPGTA